MSLSMAVPATRLEDPTLTNEPSSCPMSTEIENPRIAAAIEILSSHGGILRTRDTLQHGIHQRTLYAMRDAGILERIVRGLYRLSKLPDRQIPISSQ